MASEHLNQIVFADGIADTRHHNELGYTGQGAG
jgi:hypothetical protein